MSKIKYDLSRVSRELLEKYVDMMLCVTRNNAAGSRIDANSYLGREIVKAAEVPLRTKAEVDADIVKAVRDYCKDSQCPVSQLVFASQIDEERGHFPYYIEKLLKEETSD